MGQAISEGDEARMNLVLEFRDSTRNCSGTQFCTNPLAKVAEAWRGKAIRFWRGFEPAMCNSETNRAIDSRNEIPGELLCTGTTASSYWVRSKMRTSDVRSTWI